VPLFPIQDLSRADDIRMRRRRAVYLLGGIVLAGWMLTHGDPKARPDGTRKSHSHFTLGYSDAEDGPSVNTDAAPATEIQAIINQIPLVNQWHWSVTGAGLPEAPVDGLSRSLSASALTVEFACAGSVTIRTQPGLGDRIVVSVPHDEGAALTALSIEGGAVRQAGGCSGRSRDGNFTIAAAPGIPLSIIARGGADIRAGRFTGAVSVESDGSGDVTLDAAGTLKAVLRASGNLMVGEILGGAVETDGNGEGDVMINGGRIAVLRATSRGASDLSLGKAQIGIAQLAVYGSGDIRAHEVTGPLDITARGSGDIAIDRVESGSVLLEGDGSGDIAIRSARIGTLQAVRRGSGDLSIRGSVERSSVQAFGTGDVSTPTPSQGEAPTDNSSADSAEAAVQAGEEAMRAGQDAQEAAMRAAAEAMRAAHAEAGSPAPPSPPSPPATPSSASSNGTP